MWTNPQLGVSGEVEQEDGICQIGKGTPCSQGKVVKGDVGASQT